MISNKAFDAFRERARELLVSRGYEPVQPEDCRFLHTPVRLHLLGLQGNHEMLCVKLRVPYGSVSETSIESLCAYEVCQFRSLLARSPGDSFLRCEIWARSPNRSIHCYEILLDGIRKVAAYAR